MPDAETSATGRLVVDIVDGTPGWPAIVTAAELAAAAQLAYLRGRTSTAGIVGTVPPGPAEVAIALSDDAAVRILNARFRGIDKSTNVLSFPAGGRDGGSGPLRLGDLALARETVEREANELGISARSHVLHLVVHGILHLLGYDHDAPTAAERMENLETMILAELGIDDPYAGLEPVDGAE